MPTAPDPTPPEEPARRRNPVPPGSAEDALRRLEERLDRASEVAERLIAEAAAEAAGAALAGGGGGGAGNPGSAGNPGNPGSAGHPGSAGPGEHHGGNGSDADGTAKPPPAGWQVPDDAPAGTASDVDPFVTLVQALRDLIPPELQRRLVASVREFLLALRAVIDWYLDRLERRREEAVELQDIPIL